MAQTLGVCSWSLRPSNPGDLTARVRDVGLRHIQLALDPIRTGAWSEAEVVRLIESGAVIVRSGMMAMKGEDYSTLAAIRRTGGVRLDEHWAENLAAARDNAQLARRLGLSLVTFHAGFLPHVDRKAPLCSGDREPPLCLDRGDRTRGVMIERLRTLADVFADVGIRVALETGQETARTLLDVLDELNRPSIGVNFDPANMILYGMGDPVAALQELAAHVVQIHIKDAQPAARAGEWGEEVVVGAGAVDWAGFFQVIQDRGLDVDLMIEREAGANRVDDIRKACEHIRRFAHVGA